jgi:hypothetical protein
LQPEFIACQYDLWQALAGPIRINECPRALSAQVLLLLLSLLQGVFSRTTQSPKLEELEKGLAKFAAKAERRTAVTIVPGDFTCLGCQAHCQSRQGFIADESLRLCANPSTKLLYCCCLVRT